MREFTKSAFSYTWSSSLFGLQQMVNMFTPQGWRQSHRTAESMERIARVTAEEMGEAARGAFKMGDDVQRKSVDTMFEVFSMGMFDRNSSAGAAANSATQTASSMGEQVVNAFTQGLQAAGQGFGVIGQSMSGVVPGRGCGGSRPQAQSTGWGPVPPPPNS
jgi:hypothetical protein